MNLVEKLLMQQHALADFGRYAFRETNLQAVLNRAAQLCAECTEAKYCKICRYRSEQNDLIIEAGYGWDNLVGVAVSSANHSSPGGRAYITREPVICEDLSTSNFILPEFYPQHGIVSTVNVLIPGNNGDSPYGILEIDHPTLRKYDNQEVDFLTGFANVLAEAVATSRRINGLQRALEEKEVLSRELNHRVRNNLHLIYSMLNMEAESQPESEQSFRTVANRVQALATVYDHLLGTGLARMIAFDQYLEKLCGILRQFRPGNVELVHCSMTNVMVDLDTATAMGIAVTELITNSFKHAFPQGEGKIEINLNYKDAVPILIVGDDGVGIDPSRSSKRHGLGLVRRLVEQINASIEVRRTERGTQCEILLPSFATV